jgi:hypothetical protein
MGAQSILAYLNQLLHGQKPCHRIKIMFVGQENVGYVFLYANLASCAACVVRVRAFWCFNDSLPFRKTSLLQALKRREKRTSGKILRLGRPAVDDTRKPNPRQPPSSPDQLIYVLFVPVVRPAVVPLSTDGIDINKWMMTIPSWGPNSPRVELSAWDFAGTPSLKTPRDVRVV